MKQINVYFEDNEFEELERIKDSFGKISWKDLIYKIITKREIEKDEI